MPLVVVEKSYLYIVLISVSIYAIQYLSPFCVCHHTVWETAKVITYGTNYFLNSKHTLRSTLLTEITARQNEVALSYRKVRRLYGVNEDLKKRSSKRFEGNGVKYC